MPVRNRSALALLILINAAVFSSFPAYGSMTKLLGQKFEQFGPRINNLCVKMYNDTNRILQGLETGEVDFIDWTPTQTVIEKWSQPPYNEIIALKDYPQAGMYILDLNNNETIPSYTDWRSPTSYTEFRHAIAHLVNKTRIITEILKGYGLPMPTPVMPWLGEWFNPNADQHPYNLTEAASILDAAGFVQGSTPNPNYNSSKPRSAQFMRMYPSGHEKAGQDLDELIFYVRYDDTKRLNAAYITRDEMLSAGIPVRLRGPIRIQELQDKIYRYGDYHLFTGGWVFTLYPDYLYYLYHSENYGIGYHYPNYNNVHDDELDHWLEILINATNEDVAKTACFEAQRRLAEIAGVVPLWSPLEVKAYRMFSDRAPSGWTGIVNEKNLGVDGWWTFLNIHSNDSGQGGTVNYGLMSPIDKLNPIDFGWSGEVAILTKVYDSLLNVNPFTLSLMPWLAKSCEVGTWFNRESDANCTKFTFHLQNGVYWHDGTPFTSEDVKFSIDYLLNYKSWSIPPPPAPSEYYLVSDVKSVDAPDPNTVIIYMDVQSYWTLYNIGSLLIIPKHIWKSIPTQDALGTMPDPNLIGTGPFKLVEHMPNDHILMEANANYFKYCPIQISINTSSRKVQSAASVGFNLTVINCFSEVNTTITFSVYFDETLVENRTLTLLPFAQTELGTYSTGPLTTGLHEIRVEHTSDSWLNRTCLQRVSIVVSISEDVNDDFKVDGKDISMIAKAFGSQLGHERWDSRVDINKDQKVDGKDIGKVARKFGWTW